MGWFVVSARLRSLARPPWGPPLAALAFSAACQLFWAKYLATTGGDMAAQDAWARFVGQHPGSAYDLAWYGGVHPVSYSMIAPFVMATFGVRTTMVVSSTLASGLLTWVATRHERSGVVSYVTAAAAAGAFLGNAASGRVTFALGTLFALAALALAVGMPGAQETAGRRRLAREVVMGTLAAFATASSPVAGLFLGLVAVALWLRRQRRLAFWLGLPPVAVVATSAAFFPFSGRQPMSLGSVLLPAVMGLAAMLLAPRHWRLLRAGGAVYVVATLLAWVVPSPVGSNIVRLGLMFGGVVLLACCASGRWRASALAASAGPGVARFLLAAALVTSVVWQVAVPTTDVSHDQTPVAWQSNIVHLADELDQLHADLGRVEVVPTRSHRESTLLAAHVSLARGWNRQLDVGRNDVFYSQDQLTAATYRSWLDQWAVRFVALSTTAAPDTGAVDEARLITGGLPYLTRIWSNTDWTLYAVNEPTPLVTPPATVVAFHADELVIRAPLPGAYEVRVVASPWLSLLDADGHALPTGQPGPGTPACISSTKTDQGVQAVQAQGENWVRLHVSVAGTYRIGAPYKLPRGSACSSS